MQTQVKAFTAVRRSGGRRSSWMVMYFAVASAAAIADYAPEPGGPSARLRVLSAHPSVSHTWYLPADPCEPGTDRINTITGTKGGIFGRKMQRTSIGMPMTQIESEHDYVEQSIRAGVPFTMMIQSTTFGAAQTAYCTTHVRFVPEAGADYEARFSQVPGAEGKPGCKVTLERLTLDNSGKVQATPVNREPLPACR